MSKNIALLAVLLFSFSLGAVAQAPAIAWQKAFGGTGTEEAYSIKNTFDGGFIVAGYSTSTDGDVTGRHDSTDCWLAKISATGVLQWQKSLGGTGKDAAVCIQQTSDSGYIMVGNSTSSNGDLNFHHGDSVLGLHGDSVYNYDIWIAKLSATGNIIWQRSLGGSGNDDAHAVIQAFDGSYMVVGNTFSRDGDVTGNHGGQDGWVVKVSATGNIIWQHAFGTTGYENLMSIAQTTDSGFIACGSSQGIEGDVWQAHGSWDAWVIKISPTGNLVWSKSYGGTGADYAASIRATSDGGYIMAANTNSTNDQVSNLHHLDDYWVVKLNDTGRIAWESCFGGSDFDHPTSVIQTRDGGYAVVGYGRSNDGDITVSRGNGDFWIVKLSSAGVKQWEKAMGGSLNEYAYEVQQTPDDGYVIAGFSGSNDGDVTANHNTYPYSDFWVVKLYSEANAIEEVSKNEVAIYPNPVDDYLHLQANFVGTVTLVNVLGQKVKDKKDISDLYVGDLAPGLYILNMTNEAGLSVYQGKIQKL